MCASSLLECLSGCHWRASFLYAERISGCVAVVESERTVYGFISVGGEDRSSVRSSGLVCFLDFLEEEDFVGIVDDGGDESNRVSRRPDAGSTIWNRS